MDEEGSEEGEVELVAGLVGVVVEVVVVRVRRWRTREASWREKWTESLAGRGGVNGCLVF
jgi:hypothetical protein